MDKNQISDDGWIKSTCAYCGVGCGIEARPKSTGELEIRGDKSHPSNYGKLCTKGIALGDTVIHDGRLLSPVIKGALLQGDGVESAQKKEVSWEKATHLVADKFSEVIAEHGPDAVAFYVSGQLLTEDYYVANKLIKGFMGTANIDSNSRLCMASSVVGHKRAFGSDTVPVCYEDLEKAELVVLVGSNLAWCHPVLHQRLRAAKQENPAMRIVVIDPRRTETCDVADDHLAIASGADIALFNGLLNYLDEQNALDEEFIAAHTHQFEQAIAAAREGFSMGGESTDPHDSTLEEITQLTTEQLTQFYSAFKNTDKVVTVYSQGVNQSTVGADKVNAIINCHLATGKIGKVGSGPFSVTGQPNAMGGREVGALANTLAAHMEFDRPEHQALVKTFWEADNLATKPGLKAIDMFDAMAEGKIKAVWIMATNPMVSLPNSGRIKEALTRCPFVVVSDCMAETETTQMADVVLPAQGWSEKSGTVTNSERRISRQRRILPSPGLAKPDWWIISQVAKKMGFCTAFSYQHEGEIFQEHAKLTAFGNHLLEGGVEHDAVVTGTDAASDLNTDRRDLMLIGLSNLDAQAYSRLAPQQWPVFSLQESVTNQRLFADHQFFTADKRANFIPVRHQAPKSHVGDLYPLLLNSGRVRDHWHTMSRTGLSARLGEHTPEPFVMIHPDTAAKYSVSSRQIVTVYNGQGQCQVRAEITTDVAPNQLFIPIHWNNMTASNAKPCSLIAPYTDRLSGQPEFKHTPVNLSPCHYLSEAVFVTKKPLKIEGIDYWVRQKVSDGYLYRMASTKTTDVMAEWLESQNLTQAPKVATSLT